jgi:hypothetical protein
MEFPRLLIDRNLELSLVQGECGYHAANAATSNEHVRLFRALTLRGIDPGLLSGINPEAC